MKIRSLLTILLVSLTLQLHAQGAIFSLAEQQQVYIETPGLFEHSGSFIIDLTQYAKGGYSFPLPVGKAQLTTGNTGLKITTTSGDAVKCMFDGTVRLSRMHHEMGNVIVVRHSSGLETVYSNNAQNLVKVGDKVKAGQTIAIVGTKNKETYLNFALMVNGGRVNPETIVEINSHKLRKALLDCKKNGKHVDIRMIMKGPEGAAEMIYTGDDPFTYSNIVKIDLTKVPSERWSYPLPGAKVISGYGGARKHSGVDLKTHAGDNILAAFDGVVLRSGVFSGYGNCIEIQHANGIKTLYSHMSKNLVKVGDKVKAGQKIGIEGRTGRATTDHLHFELYVQGRRYDPAKIYDHANHKLKAVTIQVTKGGQLTIL